MWDETERGYVTREVGFLTSEGIQSHQREYAHYFSITFMIAFVAINLAIPFALVVLRNRLWSRVLLISHNNRSIHCTVIAFVAGHNIVYIVLYLYAYFLHPFQLYPVACILRHSSECSLPLDSQHYKDQVMALKIKGIVTLLVLGTELLLAAHYSKKNIIPMPCSLLKHISPLIQFLSKVLQTLFIWNVIVAVQIMVGSSLVPIGILLIVGPLYTISTIRILLTILVPLFICVHLIMSSFFGTCSLQHKCKTFFVRIVGCFLFTTLLVAAMSLYWLIILGSNNRGFKGTLLSFLPSILFSFTFWLIKKKLFCKGYTVLPNNKSLLNMNNNSYTSREEQTESCCKSPQVILLSRREKTMEYASGDSEVAEMVQRGNVAAVLGSIGDSAALEEGEVFQLIS